MTETTTVNITLDYFNELVAAEALVKALKQHGVETWEGYAQAVKGVQEEPVRQPDAVDTEAAAA